MSILNKISVLFASAFFFVSTSIIQAQEVGAQGDNSLDKSLLWKVTGNGIKPSYLFGTIHMIAASDFFWDKNMAKAFKKSKKLVMEIDMSQTMAMAVQMMQLAPMQGDQSLVDLLSEEDYEMVKKYFGK